VGKEIGKEVGKDVLLTRLYLPMFNIKVTGKTAIFNPDKDVLKIASDLHMIGLTPRTNLNTYLVEPADLSKVRHLIIGMPIFQYNLPGALEDMDYMRSLEAFEVWGRGYATRNFRLEIQFQDTHGDGQEIVPVFKTSYGTTITGIEALLEISKVVEKDSERDRLFDLWHLVELAHTATSLIPKCMDLKIVYMPDELE
jgi:hypothetical protein